MSRVGFLIASLVAIGAGSGSFMATYYGKGQPAPARPAEQMGGLGPDRHEGALAAWLKLSPDRAEMVREADPTFQTEAGGLQDELSRRREVLAGMLQSPDVTDEKVLAQVEQVIEAHNQLERRVARHVLAIRPQLTPLQQKRLMGLCAEGVRRCQRHRGGASGGQGGCGAGCACGSGSGPGGSCVGADCCGSQCCGQCLTGQGAGGRGQGCGSCPSAGGKKMTP